MQEKKHKPLWQPLPIFLFTLFFGTLSTIDGSDVRANHLNPLPDKSEKSNIELIHPPAVPFQAAQEAPVYPVIVWDKTLGGSMNDFLYNALPTPDGGYLLIGGSDSDAGADKSENRKGELNSDYWIVKVDAEGNKIWDKTIGGESNDQPRMAFLTPDGGYLLLGSSVSNASGDKSEDNKSAQFYQNDFWIVKIDANGNKVWDKTIGGNADDMFYSALATPDGGYLLAGTSASDASGDKSENSKGEEDFWIVKIDAAGNKLWDKTLGGNADDVLSSILPTPDGSYLLAGSSASNASGDKSEDNKSVRDFPKDFWIVKIDAAGNKLWDKTFGGDWNDFLFQALTTSDGGYLLTGLSGSDMSGDKSENSKGENDYWIVKIDANGNKVWDKTIGGEENDDLSTALATSDGGYLLGGASQSNASGDKSEDKKAEFNFEHDYWIVKIDANGNIIWDKTIGGNHNSEMRNIISTSDGGYLLAGYSDADAFADKSEYSKGRYDYWIVKIKEQSTPVITNLTLIDAETDQEIQVLRAGDVLLQSDKLLNIRANTYPGMVNRVVFNLAGPITHSQVEKIAPYALFGDTQGDYEGMALPAGMYTLKVTPYAGGKKGTELMISFQVEEEDPEKPTPGWDKTLGGNKSDYVSQILSISDGGYLLAGTSESGISGDKTERNKGSNDYPGDFWIVKTDPSGNKIWDKTLGGGDDDRLSSVVHTLDGGYLLAGTSGGFDYDDNFRVIKIDAEGKVVWDKTIGGSNEDELYSALATPDGGYLLVGSSRSLEEDAWIVKIDANGNIIWDKTLGGNGGDEVVYAVPTPDGGYLLAGNSSSDASGDKSENSRGGTDYWVVKIDANGNKIWDKTLGGNSTDGVNHALATPDGGYLLAGYSHSDVSGDKSEPRRGDFDYWVVKIDAEGNKVWDKTLGGYKFDYLHSALTTPDGGYLLAGYSNSSASEDKSENSKGGNDYWAIKIDADGSKVWDKTLGGSDYDRLVSVTLTPNGKYLLAGYSRSDASGNKSENSKGDFDYWVIELKDNAAPIGPVITSLTLIDAKTDEDIQILKHGDVITEAGAVNIRANTSGPVDHVVLELQGPLHHKRTEEVAPYALFGDIPTGDYAGKQLPAGVYTLMVTPFSQNKKGNAMKISFEVTDAVAISGFTLINATQDQAVGEISQGDIIDLAAFGNHQLNIRANTQPMQVEQVTFSLQGPMNRSRTEGVAPYALFGDSPAPDGSPDYDGLKMKVGTYTLTATPYADGSMGIASTITFTVIDSRNAVSRQARVYPVPTSGTINILHDGEEAQMFLLDFSGNKLLTQSVGAQPIEQLDLSSFKKGVYYLKIISAEGVQEFRVVKE